MKLKQLGNTDMQITPLGIGAWAMGAVAGNSAGASRMIMTLLPPFTPRSMPA